MTTNMIYIYIYKIHIELFKHKDPIFNRYVLIFSIDLFSYIRSKIRFLIVYMWVKLKINLLNLQSLDTYTQLTIVSIVAILL